jgi:hypothetical protein
MVKATLLGVASFTAVIVIGILVLLNLVALIGHLT